MSSLPIRFCLLLEYARLYYSLSHFIILRTYQISVVKAAIAAQKPELPATRQKLIHSGKVLKDDQVLSETGISENEFLVCMVTKEAKVLTHFSSFSHTCVFLILWHVCIFIFFVLVLVCFFLILCVVLYCVLFYCVGVV
jgi:hypothetical protein